MWKSAGRAPSLRVLPWHLPYNCEKARKNLSQGKKNFSQVKKNLSQSTVYILPKHPHITKPTHTHLRTISMSIIVQQDATIYSLLYFCKLLALHVSGGNSPHRQEHI